jgi:hypothetical protein
MKNIFDLKVTEEVIIRINNLTPDTQRKWGKMSVSQMLAHLCITYELIYENKHPKPNAFMKLVLKMILKNMVVGPQAFKHNGQTAPAFIIKEEKNFEDEKSRLIDFIKKTQELGEAYFDQKESHSFGILTITEWNNMLYKHLDHHLIQFGV